MKLRLFRTGRTLLALRTLLTACAVLMATTSHANDAAIREVSRAVKGLCLGYFGGRIAIREQDDAINAMKEYGYAPLMAPDGSLWTKALQPGYSGLTFKKSIGEGTLSITMSTPMAFCTIRYDGGSNIAEVRALTRQALVSDELPIEFEHVGTVELAEGIVRHSYVYPINEAAFFNAQITEPLRDLGDGGLMMINPSITKRR